MNNLNIDLIGKYIILKKEALTPAFQALEERIVRVAWGYGAKPNARGTAIFCEHASGETTRWEGLEVERLATDAEIAEHFPTKMCPGCGVDIEHNQTSCGADCCRDCTGV